MVARFLSSLKSAAVKMAGAIKAAPVWDGGPTDIIASVRSDGVIEGISASAAEIIGAAGPLAGRSLFDFIKREDRPRLRALLDYGDEIASGYGDPSKLSANVTLLRVRRAATPASLVARPRKNGGVQMLIRPAIAHIAGGVRGISPANDVRPLEAATACEQGALGAEPDLIADPAHEMKTPLNAIMGFADAMVAETFGPVGVDEKAKTKYAEYIGHIHASGAHLTALIGAAQDYARSQTGQYRIEKKDRDAGALARECAAMVRGTAEAAGLTVSVDVEPDLPHAMLDDRAIRQILINLLSNAVKFTREGNINLKVDQRDQQIAFTVSDTGVGMNKIELAKLGGRWSDTHRKGVRGAEGSGLGLSLAFELARLHGGALTIGSEKGAGTQARLVIPIADFPVSANPGQPGDETGSDIQSQLDRVNAFRRERAQSAA